MTSLTTAIQTAAPAAARRPSRLRTVLDNGAVRAGGAILLLMLCLAVAAPWLYTIDPNTMDPASSQLAPGTRAEKTPCRGPSSSTRRSPAASSRHSSTASACGARTATSIPSSVTCAPRRGGRVWGDVTHPL